MTLWWKDTEWSAILNADGVPPTEVGFSAHDHGYYVVPGDSNNSCLQSGYRRPIAYVAANNHPSFVVAGQYWNITVPGIYRTRWAASAVSAVSRENAFDEARGNGETLIEYDVNLLSAQAWFSWEGHWGHIDDAPAGPGHGAWDDESQRRQLRRHWQMPPSEIEEKGDQKTDWWKQSGCHSSIHVDDQSWWPSPG